MLSVVILTIVVASVAVAYWRVDQVRSRQEDDLRRVAATLQTAPFPVNRWVLEVMKGLSGADFVVLDSGGKAKDFTLSFGADEGKPLLDLPLLDLQADRDLESFSASPAISLGGRNYLGSQVPLVRRLPSGEAVSLVILYPEDRWTAAVQQAAYPSLIAGGVMVLAVVVVTTVLARRLVRPIQRLGQQAAAIAAGDFTPVAVARRDDEIRDLAVSINSMTEKLSRYEEQVRRSERLRTLGQLGAGMAHQLRNSATGASMAIELHQRECPGGAAGESLEVALRQLRLMESYLQRFLALGRSQPVPHQSVPLAELVEDVLGLVRPACVHARIDLRFCKPPEPLLAWGDPESLRHVLVNLLLNAVEAASRQAETPAQVTVELARRGDDRVLLRVSDSGPGPTEAAQAQLFEPFVTDKPEGTGLGLYMARQIVEAHQGAISWQRCAGMTCFTVELPERMKDGAHSNCRR